MVRLEGEEVSRAGRCAEPGKRNGQREKLGILKKIKEVVMGADSVNIHLLLTVSPNQILIHSSEFETEIS